MNLNLHDIQQITVEEPTTLNDGTYVLHITIKTKKENNITLTVFSDKRLTIEKEPIIDKEN